jgi:hypothetical protein
MGLLAARAATCATRSTRAGTEAEEIYAAMSGTMEANRKRNGSEGCDASWAIERLVEELECNAPVRTFGPLYRNTLST